MRRKRLMRLAIAIQIQRIARGWLVRMHMKLLKEATLVAQRWWRAIFAITLRAVLRIQRTLHRQRKMRMALNCIRRMGIRWKYKRHRCARTVRSMRSYYLLATVLLGRRGHSTRVDVDMFLELL